MNNKRVIFLAVLFLSFFINHTMLHANGVKDQEGKLIGKWYAEDLEQSVISIVKKSDGTLEGTIVESADSKFIGKRVLYDLKYEGDDQAFKGRLYSPKRNMEIDCTITFESSEKLKIVGKKLFMTRTFYWDKR